jgi:hypothetical protein
MIVQESMKIDEHCRNGTELELIALYMTAFVAPSCPWDSIS